MSFEKRAKGETPEPTETVTVEIVEQIQQPQPDPAPQQQYQQTQFEGNSNVNNTSNPQTPNKDPNAKKAGSFFAKFRPALSKTSDATIRHLIELADEVIQKDDDEGNLKNRYKLHAFSREKNTGTFSGFALSVKGSVNNKPVAVFYTFILEKSREPIAPYYQNNPYGGQSKIIVTTAEAYNADFVREVGDQVRRDWGNTIPTRAISAQIIERELNIETTDEIFPLISDAVNALLSYLAAAKTNRVKFAVKDLVEDPATEAVAHIGLNGELTRGNALPIRSDIVSTLSAESAKRTGGPVVAEKSQKLTAASAFVDLIPTPPAQTFGQPTGVLQPYYVPRITITNLTTDLPESSLEFALMGIANVTVLSRNKAYGVVWKTHHSNPEVGNMRDFGAVGLQIDNLSPEGAGMIDVSGSDQELRRLMDTVLHPSIVYSIEVSEISPNAWLTKIFAEAAIPGDAGKAARGRIMEAMNNLTSNRFGQVLSNMCGGNVPELWCTQGTGDRNYVGYYTLGSERRDIREIDLLAVLNLIGRKDIPLVEQFISTLSTKSGEDWHSRLSRRLAILSSIFNEIQIKGYSDKYNFNGVFINALVSSMEQTGLVVRNNAAGLRDNGPVAYTVSDWASAMSNPSIGAQLFGGMGQYQAYGQPQGFQNGYSQQPQYQQFNGYYQQ